MSHPQQWWHKPGTRCLLSTFSLVPSDQASLAPRRGARSTEAGRLGSLAPEEWWWVQSLNPDSHRRTASHRGSHLGILRSPAQEHPHWPLGLPRPCPTCWGYDCLQMLGPEVWMCGWDPGSVFGPQAGPRGEVLLRGESYPPRLLRGFTEAGF